MQQWADSARNLFVKGWIMVDNAQPPCASRGEGAENAMPEAKTVTQIIFEQLEDMIEIRYGTQVKHLPLALQTSFAPRRWAIRPPPSLRPCRNFAASCPVLTAAWKRSRPIEPPGTGYRPRHRRPLAHAPIPSSIPLTPISTTVP